MNFDDQMPLFWPVFRQCRRQPRARYHSVIEAWQKAIGTAIAIAGDQVSHGNPFFGAEVTLEEGNRRIGRYVVAVGATPLNNQPSDD